MISSVPIPGTRAGLPVYIPPPPPKVVLRPRLIERLDEGLAVRLRLRAGTPGVTLISAPAGFGKITLSLEQISAIVLGIFKVEIIGRRTLVRRPNLLMVPATYLVRYGPSR